MLNTYLAQTCTGFDIALNFAMQVNQDVLTINEELDLRMHTLVVEVIQSSRFVLNRVMVGCCEYLVAVVVTSLS